MARAELLGSVLLPVEVLAKPLRAGMDAEAHALTALLSHVRLIDVSMPIAALATALAAQHGLAAIDAVHLATAVDSRAQVFLTNNSKDFGSVQVEGLAIEFPEVRPA